MGDGDWGLEIGDELEIGNQEIQQASIRSLAVAARHCAMREENGNQEMGVNSIFAAHDRASEIKTGVTFISSCVFFI